MKVRIPATNVADLLRRAAERSPTHHALVADTHAVSFADLDAEVDAVARGLASVGLVAGHRVAVAMSPRIPLVVACLAALRAGLVVVPLDPSAPVGDLARVLAHSGARLCVADAEAGARLRDAIARFSTADRSDGPRDAAAKSPRLPTLVEVGDSSRAQPTGELRYDDLRVGGRSVVAPLDPETPAVLAARWGSADVLPAALLSHRALLAFHDAFSQTRRPAMQRDEVVVAAVPFFSHFGLHAVVGSALLYGATLVLAPPSGVDLPALVSRHGATCVCVTPAALGEWADRGDPGRPLHSVRRVLCGGGRLAGPVARRFERRTGIAVDQCYGAPEGGPVVASTLESPRRTSGSVGRSLPGIEVRVVDDHGREAAAGDPGEVQVRGRTVFSGYWPQAGGPPSDAEGWVGTGDAGVLDEDGDLHVLGRRTDVALVSGFPVHPAEVEDAALECSQVRECAVAAAPEGGLVAYVVARDGADLEALPAAVLASCESRLARFKVPARVVVVPRIVRSSTGEPVRSLLAAGDETGRPA